MRTEKKFRQQFLNSGIRAGKEFRQKCLIKHQYGDSSKLYGVFVANVQLWFMSFEIANYWKNRFRRMIHERGEFIAFSSAIFIVDIDNSIDNVHIPSNPIEKVLLTLKNKFPFHCELEKIMQDK